MCLGLVQNGYTHLKKRGQQKYSCEADCTTCFLCHYSISENKSPAPASGYKSSAPAAKAALSASVGTSSAQGHRLHRLALIKSSFQRRAAKPRILRSGERNVLLKG